MEEMPIDVITKAIIIPIASSYLIAYKESGKYKFKE